jgi:tRNA(adenine34) deaminase
MIGFDDEYFMKQAIRQAEMGLSKNEVPIGAVVVVNNTIIAKSHNMTETLNDVTAHAEMLAITSASNYLGAKYLNDCTIYVTLEPCIMCASALSWAQIGKVVWGASDEKKGFTTINKNILHKKTNVINGILENECSKLIIDFFKKKRNKF